MHRYRLLILAAAATLAACSTSPVTLNYADKENPARVTSISGLKSHDAANVANFGTYAHAKATEKQKESCSFEALDGKEMSFSGVKKITCYQGSNSEDGVGRPTQAQSEFVQNLDAAGRFVQKATPLGLGAMALSDRNNQRSSNERINERITDANAETVRRENDLNAAQTGALIDALKEKPSFFVLPAGATPTE